MDIYKEKAKNLSDQQKQFFAVELLDTETVYYCPNIESFKLSNDPYDFITGVDFNAVVNRCDIAKQID